MDKVQNMTNGILLQGDISCYLSVPSINFADGTADIDIRMFSGQFDKANVSIEYRTGTDGAWQTDMAIATDASLLSRDNSIYGMPCSRWGAKNTVRWIFGQNGITPGTYFELKVMISPVCNLFSHVSPYSSVETVLSHESNNIEAITDHKIVNKDSAGNYLCVSATEFYVLDRQANKILTVGGLNNPKHAQENLDGLNGSTYIVLDSGNNSIAEYTSTGAPVKYFFGGAILDNPPYFYYDAFTRNILVSGGAIPKVYEISWDDLDIGTVLWSHGQPVIGGDDSHLDHPLGVSYDSGNRDVVLIADSWNKRIVMVDRTPPVETVTNLYNVTFEDGVVVVPIVNCYRVFMVDGTVVISEDTGEPQFFGTTPATHPTLNRALAGRSVTDSKNKLEQYRNLVFAPLKRTL